MFTYKVVDEKADSKESVIEKTGITAKFTIQQIEEAEKLNEKQLKELKGMLQVREAIMQNVVTNHPFVTEMSEEDRFTVHMYHEAFVFAKMCNLKIKEIEEALEGSRQEREEITRQVGVAVKVADLVEAPTEAPQE